MKSFNNKSNFKIFQYRKVDNRFKVKCLEFLKITSGRPNST